MRLLNVIRNRIWKFCKKIRCRSYRKRFTNPGVSIISMNCTGGILYHDLGQQFLSPTVNMYMKAEDFIKFCENLRYYLSIEQMIECKAPEVVGDRQYPVAILGDIYLYLVHYKSLDEACRKWNERKKRINYDKIVILNNDREGMTDELMDRFESLPYKKVMFVHKPTSRDPQIFHYLPGYEQEEQVGIITDPKSFLGQRPIDQFDWVRFLNEE